MTERGFKILVVDDDANARHLMDVALRNAGYEVRLAEGSRDGLAKFRAEPCDLVMLGVEMPDLVGFQICAMLRAEAGPLLPIVMITGMDDLRSVEAAYECGATDFIPKPVNWALIGNRMRYLFRNRQAMLDLHAAEARSAAVLNAIPDLMFELDSDGRYIDYRGLGANLLAAPTEAFLGRTLAEVLPPAAAEVCKAVLLLALEHGHASGAQIELQLAKGRSWFELSASRKAAAAGERPHVIMLSRDITKRKVSEDRIARMAYYDSLTGLPNRQSFLERVDREIPRATQRGHQLAVLFMDLDGFKIVNDTMGHAAGDLLLQWTADRLREGLRPSDLLSRPMGLFAPDGAQDNAGVEIARLGGDEFTALLVGIHGPGDAVSVAQRIGHMMRQPFELEGREINLSTSIGIAVFPGDGCDGATLLKHADTAMYHAKKLGRDNAQIYNATLTQQVERRMEFDTSLRAALERGEFRLEYQPQVDLASGRIHSVEALIRWIHPARGLVSPLDFIPLAEELGLIDRIGHWVLRTACTDAAGWSRSGSPVTVAVNLSPLQFGASDLPQIVMSVLADTGLAPSMLELEVTEGALMENSVAVRSALRTLHEGGVRIALDDFGTGNSSLAYLMRMPIDHIKVDRCFINDLLHGGESEVIVRAVLAMAHTLGMSVTAEGVETAEQVQVLQDMACDRIQGHHFSRPVPAADIPALLSQQWVLRRSGSREQGREVIGRQGPCEQVTLEHVGTVAEGVETPQQRAFIRTQGSNRCRSRRATGARRAA